MSNDEHEQRIVNKLEEIQQQEIEALRRAGVAKTKEQGLEIESTESVRLFREARGYLLRLRELREDLEAERRHADYYNAERILGHIDDYNRILRDLRENKSFENCVSRYDELSYERGEKSHRIIIGNQAERITTQDISMGRVQNSVTMNGSTTVETFVLPRIIRLTKDIENSIIGRCASGKRPD